MVLECVCVCRYSNVARKGVDDGRRDRKRYRERVAVVVDGRGHPVPLRRVMRIRKSGSIRRVYIAPPEMMECSSDCVFVLFADKGVKLGVYLLASHSIVLYTRIWINEKQFKQYRP